MTMLMKRGRNPRADLPAHVRGVKEGNAKGNYERQAGWTADGKQTAESATGINPASRAPIDPRMPNLPPG
jgi:hypothetical protein